MDMRNEWYTPYKYIQSAKDVMGRIDLDPASCSLANMRIQADCYYGQSENGLEQSWQGNVWLNPPFGTSGQTIHKYTGGTHTGASNIKLFSAKLVAEYKAGNVKQAIFLCRSETKAIWFCPLWDYTLCFCRDEIFFDCPDGTKKHHRFGTVFVYLGEHTEKFVKEFSAYGCCVRRVTVSGSIEPEKIGG